MDGFSASQTESNNGYPSLFRATVTVEGRVKFGVRCRATVPSLAGLQGRLAIARVYVCVYIYKTRGEAMLHASPPRQISSRTSLSLCVCVCVCVTVCGTRRYYRGNDRDNKGHKFFPLTRRPLHRSRPLHRLHALPSFRLPPALFPFSLVRFLITVPYTLYTGEELLTKKLETMGGRGGRV